MYELEGAITHVEQGGGPPGRNRTHTPGTPCGALALPHSTKPTNQPTQYHN
jgi:hypothetical protein